MNGTDIYILYRRNSDLEFLGVSPASFEVDIWKPTLAWLKPKDAPASLSFWWFYHFTRILRKRNSYSIFQVRQGDSIIGRTVASTKCFKFPFMGSSDIHIGPTWTNPQYRKRGIATSISKQVIEHLAVENLTFWTIVAKDNKPSQRLCENLGFVRFAEIKRNKRLGLSIYGSVNLASNNALRSDKYPARNGRKTNKDVYRGEEFCRWSSRKGLIYAEQFLIDRYLAKSPKTLEAGTAGGRIILEMSKQGFVDLHGYDYLPEFIEVARTRNEARNLEFKVDDAISLQYQDQSFGQILYLQQILSTIEDPDDRVRALSEAYRILQPGGTALFSFLSYEVRTRNLLFLAFLLYLIILRKLRGSNKSTQLLPWLRQGGNPNFKALLDREPYNYWFRTEEATAAMANAGFQVLALGTTRQLENNRICKTCEELKRLPLGGMLYFVCKKPLDAPGTTDRTDCGNRHA
jgi:ubiquinone/menaquinone biosynthesis C-methylase UbiE/RimJ/RimL family protein N-acetyltransferase